jgi:putative glutamine amidotransferase
MSTNPMIVIPCRRIAERIPSQGVQVSYLQALQNAGAEPVLLPSHSSSNLIERMVQSADGILLAGGEDISPQKGGAYWAPSAQSNDIARDELELELVRVARATKKPMLGICRGVQLLNVAYGGELIADISSDNPSALAHMGTIPSCSEPESIRNCFGAVHHEVEVLDGSWLHQIFAQTELAVNSFHHQAIHPKGLGDGLRASAWAPDGTIEAVEGTDNEHFVVGVQWHPEMLEHFGISLWKTLFQRFVDVCRHSIVMCKSPCQ